MRQFEWIQTKMMRNHSSVVGAFVDVVTGASVEVVGACVEVVTGAGVVILSSTLDVQTASKLVWNVSDGGKHLPSAFASDPISVVLSVQLIDPSAVHVRMTQSSQPFQLRYSSCLPLVHS